MSGIDQFTGKLLLQTAISGENGNTIAADIYKEINGKQTPAHKIAQAQEVYTKLGYKPGAIVELNYGMGAIGEIVSFRNETGGLYGGDRYPVIVKGPNSTYEQSIFITHYEDVPHYKGNPEQLLENYKDDLGLKLVTDIKNPKEVMYLQSALHKMNFFSLIDYLDEYTIEGEKEKDYVYKYAMACLEKKWNTELNLIENASDYIDSEDFAKIENADVKDLLIRLYTTTLSTYPLDALQHIHHYISQNTDIKRTHPIITAAVIVKLKNIDETRLYAFADTAKHTSMESLVFSELDSRIA